MLCADLVVHSLLSRLVKSMNIEIVELCVVGNCQRKQYWRLFRIDMLNVAPGEWVRDEFYNG